MGSIIFAATSIFQVTVFSLTLYYIIIALIGIYKKNRKVKYRPEKSFALIVAAHNEEMVVGQVVESLNSLDYPKELYDIFVIADNCSDNTAKIAREHGALVFERFNAIEKGKGYALKWMFEKVYNMEKKYDVVAVFDADNLASRNFLNEMNSKMQEGYNVVQGYLDSKNPSDSLITQCYSIAFWSSNRIFQLARQNIGLSAQLGGTGFCIAVDTLKRIGWDATCLTEDLEFTCKLVLNDEKVGWAHNAIMYDEKPLTLRQSWNQRKRWMQGYADVASRMFMKLITKAITKGDFRAFDCALYILQPFVFAALGVSVLLNLLAGFGGFSSNIFVVTSLFTPVAWKTFGMFQFLFTPLIMAMEGKLRKRMLVIFALYSSNVFLFDFISKLKLEGYISLLLQGVYIAICALLAGVVSGKKAVKEFIWYLLYGVYTLTWVPISILGIMHKDKKEWSHTRHTRQVAISDLESI